RVHRGHRRRRWRGSRGGDQPRGHESHRRDRGDRGTAVLQRMNAQHAVDAAFRESWGRVVAALIRRTGNWDLAEECAQEAFVEAVRRWPVEGVPQRPVAWLTTVAGHRAIDRLRRAARGAQLLEEIGREAGEEIMFDEAEEIEDD